MFNLRDIKQPRTVTADKSENFIFE